MSLFLFFSLLIHIQSLESVSLEYMYFVCAIQLVSYHIQIHNTLNIVYSHAHAHAQTLVSNARERGKEKNYVYQIKCY